MSLTQGIYNISLTNIHTPEWILDSIVSAAQMCLFYFQFWFTTESFKIQWPL